MEFYKYCIFEGFRQNGLQIRIRREKLRISRPDENSAFFEKCWISKFIMSETLLKHC